MRRIKWLCLIISGCLLWGCTANPVTVLSDTNSSEAVSAPSEKLSSEKTPQDAVSSDSATAPIIIEPDSMRLDISPQELGSDVVGQLDEIAQRYESTGVQLAVIRDGSVRYHYEFGFADKSEARKVVPDTKFRCASLSKPIVAMTALAATDSIGFDLDKDIGDYFGYRVRNENYPEIPITPRMLMVHTSSIIDGSRFLQSRNSTSSVPIRELLSDRSSFNSVAPGRRYLYSNFGVAVLAAALEVYSSHSFDQLAKQYLFDKIGLDCGFLATDIQDSETVANLYSYGQVSYSRARQLEESYCDTLGQTHHLYQGNLTISAIDYAELLCVLLNKGSIGRLQILSPEQVDEMLKAQFSADGNSYGLCLDILDTVIEGRTIYCHTGSNFGMFSSFAFDSDSKDGVVVFTSGANASINRTGLYDICAEMIHLCFAP